MVYDPREDPPYDEKADQIESRAEVLYEQLCEELDNVDWLGLDPTDYIDYDKLFERLRDVAEKRLEDEKAEREIDAWEKRNQQWD